MEIVKTRTGFIFYDAEKRLEWLCVGDYGKENNIKADFLGLKKKIEGVQHKDVNMADKTVITISTQKGCPMQCDFCDAPKYGFHGNVSADEMMYMIDKAIAVTNLKSTDRLNIHFARMGEPTFNPEVLKTAERLHTMNRSSMLNVHPVVSTMLPRTNKNLEQFIHEWCSIKNGMYAGEAGLQLSINSTDDGQRQNAFRGLALSLEEISKLTNTLPMPRGRKYTLNFAVTESTILDAKNLDSLFDKNKFIVKITPIHQTREALASGYDVSSSYSEYDVYAKFKTPLLELGVGRNCFCTK